MANIEILAVCGDKGILDVILRLIKNNPDWNATGATNLQQATALLAGNNYQLVLIGSGLTADDERELQLAAISLQKNIGVIKHYGGGSGLLFGEIFDTLIGLNK